MAAERLAADADAADDLGFVAHADLAQLDAGVEDGGELFDELTKVDALVGCEVEDDLGAVKGVFDADKLHVEAAVGDLLLTDGKSVFGGAAVLQLGKIVHGGGNADDRAQWLDDLALRHPMGGQQDARIFHAAAGLDDDVFIGVDLLAEAVKIIYLSGALELNANDLWHKGGLLSTGGCDAPFL